MNDTATVISAIAGVVTASSLVLAAFSKCGPVIKELNKMWADQHKRATAAKTKETQKSNTETKATIRQRSRTMPWWSLIVFVVVPVVLMIAQPFLSTAVTPTMLTTYFSCSITVLLFFMLQCTSVVYTVAEQTYELLHASIKLQVVQVESRIEALKSEKSN